MIKRDLYMRKIIPFIDKDVIKVLTGMRRSGKSVMLELIQDYLLSQGNKKEQFVCINFEDADNEKYKEAKLLHDYIDGIIKYTKEIIYVFLDEIQDVFMWEKTINSLRLRKNCDIYITGSNSKLLSGELATHIGGRYVHFDIYPFSYGEFCKLIGEKDFSKYIEFGGMPFLQKLDFDVSASRQYLQDIYNSIILKDIVSRHNIRDFDLLDRIIKYALSHIGTTFSANSISRYFKQDNRKVAPETVLKFLGYCEDAQLLHKARRQEIKGKKILLINEKYYANDHALRNNILGKKQNDIERILENIVYLELLRRDYSVSVGKNGDKEIDFIAENGEDKLYIQVCYLLASPETINREFGAFKGIDTGYPRLVLSMDSIDMSRDGIKHINCEKWLLGE